MILSFDRARALRRIRPRRSAAPLKRRDDSDLPFLTSAAPGPELLLDTCVYIDALKGRTPAEADALLQLRIVNHSTVALAELTHLFGRLDPRDPRSASALDELSGVIDDMPPHRVLTPSARCMGEAGMLAGLAARLTGRPADGGMLNDATLFLQAREAGLALLTRNLADFDILDALLPGSKLLLYRAA